MNHIIRTLFSTLAFFFIFFFSLQAAPTQPTLLDRFFFRQLSIDSGDEENYRIQDQTGFGSAPSSELTDKASGFLDSLGYHVFDIGLYYIHSFTTDKAQELINQKIKALNKNYSKYVLFGYGLSSNGINHQVYIKWGDETEEISIQNKNDFVVALGDAMIGKSASAGPSANTIDETEIWALEKIADFFESDNSFLAMSLPEENSGGLQAHLLTRSNDDEIVQTPIGLQISNNGILVSPSGVPIKIPKKTIISFKHGNQYENLLFAGCLIKFLLPNGETYAAMATRKDSTSNIPKDFAGFFNIITKKKYAYEGFEVSTNSFYPVILGDHLSASDDDCNTTYLSKIEFKPYQVDKYGVGHRNFVLDLKDEGQIAELQDLFWIETDLPSMRYCLPRHTSEQIQKAEEKVYNPYNMGGVRIKANSTVLGGVPTFFYGYYDYDEPDIMFYFYWSPEDLTWLEFTPNEAEETVFNFMQLMSDMGHLYKQMAEDVWSVFKGTAFTLHGALDLIGLIPIIGEPADILNGIIYAAEGDKMNAVLSFGAIVPVAGIASTVGKHLQPYTTKVWNVAKKIRLTKIRKVCSIGLKGEEEPVNRSFGCERIIRNIDPVPILARAKALKLPENTIIKLQNDLFEGGDEFALLLRENDEAIKAWNIVKNRKAQIRLDKSSIEALSKVLSNPNRSALGLTDEILGSIKGSKNLAYKDVLKTIDDFGLNVQGKNIVLKDFDKLLTDLGKGNGWSDGAEWTLKYISTKSDDLANKTLKFEVYEKWDDVSGSYIRITDVIDESNLTSKIFYEFKSVKIVPPGKFIEQFMKDLSFPEVFDLSQLNWIFDGRKLPADFASNMIAEINSLPLTDALAVKLLDDIDAKAIDLTSEILSQFENIFKLIN